MTSPRVLEICHIGFKEQLPSSIPGNMKSSGRSSSDLSYNGSPYFGVTGPLCMGELDHCISVSQNQSKHSAPLAMQVFLQYFWPISVNRNYQEAQIEIFSPIFFQTDLKRLSNVRISILIYEYLSELNFFWGWLNIDHTLLILPWVWYLHTSAISILLPRVHFFKTLLLACGK